MKKDWEIKSFEDCIENVKYTTKIPSKDYKQEGAFPIVSQEEELISGYWDNESDLFSLTKPVVIFGDHTRVLKYVDFDFVLGADGVKILQPKDFLDTKFFMYFLSNANIKHLGYARHYRLLKELNVFVPSLKEQKRIVKILDEKFAQLETIKANAQTNLQNAKDLFQSQLAKAFSNATWEKKRFENCIENVKYTSKIPSRNYKQEGLYPIISQEEELISGYWDNEDDVFKITKPIVIFGDHTRVLKYIDFDFVLGADGVKILQPKDFLDTKFFMYFLKNANIKHLGYARHYRLLKELNIFVPPLPEQKRIVRELDTLSEKVRQLQEIYTKQIANCAELKQAYLQKAFEGEL